MATRARPAAIVHQALHGYRDGHRLLARSKHLSEASQAAMLVFSDSLVPGVLGPDESYLCGYPLAGDNAYALARTWSAPELPRPGSVWTHTLVLDYATLAVTTDPSALLALFSRPTRDALRGYDRPLEAPAAGRRDDARVDAIEDDRAARVLGTLYSDAPATRVELPTGSPGRDEALALAVWRQMWPGLRREFAFFTRIAGEAPAAAAGCALRFDAGGGVATRAGEDDLPPAAMATLLADLPHPGPTPLRTFLGRHAYDAPEPRREVGPLLALMARLDEGPAAVARAAAAAYPRRGSMPRLKRDLLSAAFADPGIEAVAGVVEAFRHEDLPVAPAYLADLVRRDPRGAIRSLVRAATPSRPGELGHAVLAEVLRVARPAELADLDLDADAKVELARACPDVAREPAFWPGDPVAAGALLRSLLRIPLPPETLLEGFRGVLDGEAMRALVTTTPEDAPAAILGAVCRGTATASPADIASILASRQDVIAAATTLSRIPPAILEATAKVVVERSLPLVVDGATWLAVLHDGPIDVVATPYLAACLFASALKADRPTARRLMTKVAGLFRQGGRKPVLPWSAHRFVDDAMLSAGVKGVGVTGRTVTAVLDAHRVDGVLSPDVFLLSNDEAFVSELVRAVEEIDGQEAVRKTISALPERFSKRLTEDHLGKDRKRIWWWW